MNLQTLSGFGDVDTSTLNAAVAKLRSIGRGAGIVDVQRKLQAAGISPGKVDGIWGPKTETAFRTYWARKGAKMGAALVLAAVALGGSGAGTGATGGGRPPVVVPDVIPADAPAALKPGGSWKDFFQQLVATGVTYLQKKDADKLQQQYAAQGIDTQVVANGDGTFTVKRPGPSTQQMILYAALGVGAIALLAVVFGGSRKSSRRAS